VHRRVFSLVEASDTDFTLNVDALTKQSQERNAVALVVGAWAVLDLEALVPPKAGGTDVDYRSLLAYRVATDRGSAEFVWSRRRASVDASPWQDLPSVIPNAWNRARFRVTDVRSPK